MGLESLRIQTETVPKIQREASDPNLLPTTHHAVEPSTEPTIRSIPTRVIKGRRPLRSYFLGVGWNIALASPLFGPHGLRGTCCNAYTGIGMELLNPKNRLAGSAAVLRVLRPLPWCHRLSSRCRSAEWESSDYGVFDGTCDPSGLLSCF